DRRPWRPHRRRLLLSGLSHPYPSGNQLCRRSDRLFRRCHNDDRHFRSAARCHTVRRHVQLGDSSPGLDLADRAADRAARLLPVTGSSPDNAAIRVSCRPTPRRGKSGRGEAMIAALILLFLVVLLVLRIPIGFALIVAGSVGLTVTSGWEAAYGVLKTAPLTTTGIYELITVPMFLLMAEFVVASGIADDLFRSAAIWIGRVRGGLAIATALAGAGFAAISGSSTASAATLSSTSLPAMIKHEYRDSLAAGVVSISGTLATLIPPSIAVLVYGLIAEESIGKLLIACVIPGLVVTAAIILTVMLIGWMEPGSMPRGQSFTLREKLRSSKVALPMILLFLAVTGIIYFGIATPTEASSLG